MDCITQGLAGLLVGQKARPDPMFFSHEQAGWEFNEEQADLAFVGEDNPFVIPSYRKYSGEAATEAWDNGDLTAEELAQFGFFRRFEDEYHALYAPIEEGNGLREGDNPAVDATRLAEVRADANKVAFAGLRHSGTVLRSGR